MRDTGVNYSYQNSKNIPELKEFSNIVIESLIRLINKLISFICNFSHYFENYLIYT